MNDRRGRGPKALGAVLPELARKSLRRGGATLARLVADWPTIVGETLAPYCVPRRLVDRDQENEAATLVLGAHGPIALELQHLEPVLIERINAHLGYGAIKRIRLVQDAPRQGPSRAKPPARPSEGPAQPLPDVGAVEDSELRAALARLGQAVAARAESPSKG
ncbi:MAG: DUF721 domain-containing protein [Alphaproteobacteria bacterium]|mgnify:CR=1 FL=1